MLMEWLELLRWVLVALVVWLGCAIVIARTEEGEARDAQRDRADGGCRRDVTGTGRVAGQPSQAENPRPGTPRLYSNVVHDHRDHGDEDPPQYETGLYACRKCGARLFRARDGVRCPNCGLLSGKLILDKTVGIAPRRSRARRRLELPLSDEAQAELMRKIFRRAGVIAFLAGMVTMVFALLVVSTVERVIGWPQGHLLRRFERRIDRLRRRALRQTGDPSPDGPAQTAARRD